MTAGVECYQNSPSQLSVKGLPLGFVSGSVIYIHVMIFITFACCWSVATSQICHSKYRSRSLLAWFDYTTFTRLITIWSYSKASEICLICMFARKPIRITIGTKVKIDVWRSGKFLHSIYGTVMAWTKSWRWIIIAPVEIKSIQLFGKEVRENNSFHTSHIHCCHISFCKSPCWQT